MDRLLKSLELIDSTSTYLSILIRNDSSKIPGKFFRKYKESTISTFLFLKYLIKSHLKSCIVSVKTKFSKSICTTILILKAKRSSSCAKSFRSNCELLIDKNSSCRYLPAILEEDYSTKCCSKSKNSRKTMCKLSYHHTSSRPKVFIEINSDDTIAEKQKSSKKLNSQDILEYVCWLVDANFIYEAALLTYDLELAAMTARCTQKVWLINYVRTLKNTFLTLSP